MHQMIWIVVKRVLYFMCIISSLLVVDFGVQLGQQRKNRKVVELSTCHGQMVLHVVPTNGVNEEHVSSEIWRNLRRSMVGGVFGWIMEIAPGVVGEE